MTMISQRLRPFGTTIFSEMTRLAQQHGAINLAQGFPDFEGPEGVREAAVEALRAGENQYARSMGHPALVNALAARQERLYGTPYDALSEVLVFSGATEGIAATLLGLVEPGDEVVVFEPFYDSYPAMTALAGGTIRPYTLRFPDFTIDFDELRKLFNERTKLLILNTPSNPTGKVFTRAELEAIAKLCVEHDVLVMADEVYEHLTFDGAKHVPMATIPGMRERTITLSSSGKTWSFTGWKIGWATGPAPMIAAVQAAHQFLTFSSATPLQVAVARAVTDFSGAYLEELGREYARKRAFLADVLEEAGLRVSRPQGTYFVLADFSARSDLDDRAFARFLTEHVGVACIPPSVFYAGRPEAGRKLARFAFCKRDETLERAAERLRRWGR